MLRALTIAFCLLLVGLAAAAADFPYRGDESFEGKVRAPGEFLGVPLGDRFTPHHDVMRYCRAVADASPRAHLVEYGRTVEGRELVLLFISSEQNLARLDDIQELQQKLADPRRLADGESVDTLLPRLPAVVWLGYNVHGNESSGTEAALRVIYQLVDGSDATTRKLRRNALVIVDPLLNPDGRERYLHWYATMAQAPGNPDPDAREHSEPSPGGRTNHYYFDLNRDWAWLSQRETRARFVQYLRWQPLVHVDVHEMSSESTYFFFPAAKPFNLNYPEHTLRWGEVLGKGNAAAFDRFGWLYYTAEGFDLLYPGYGDSWPSLHGSIGMTYEQAGGGRAGLQIKRRDGTILTLHDRLHHHFVASLATVETSVDRKEDLQRSFHQFRASAIETGGKGPVVEYIFPPADVPERLERLVKLLVDQGVEVERTLEDAVAESLTNHLGETKELKRLPAGTYIVPLAQPAGRLARALLEPEAKVTENRFYDISAWSLPFAMGLSAYASAERVDVPREPVTEPRRATGSVSGRARYAYLLRWKGVSAVRALHALQSAGIPTRLIPEEVEIGDAKFAAGTIMIPVRPGDEKVHEKAAEVSRAHGVELVAVDSGWTDKGIDLGSGKIAKLAPPRIAVATGSGVSSGSFGAVWYLFERELELPFAAFALDRIGSLDLDEYNVLILPSGFGYSRALSESTVTRLETWVSRGGVIVAYGGGAFALTAESTGLTRVSSKAPEVKKPDKEEKPVRRKIEELDERRRERQVPGNIFRVDLDEGHPLSFGLPQKIYALMSGTRSFALSGGAGDVGMFTDDTAVSGYISEENIAKRRRRVFLAEERRGRGAVILFAGDPNFRLFWRGLTPLFLNAVFLRTTH